MAVEYNNGRIPKTFDDLDSSFLHVFIMYPYSETGNVMDEVFN